MVELGARDGAHLVLSAFVLSLVAGNTLAVGKTVKGKNLHALRRSLAYASGAALRRFRVSARSLG